MPLGRWNLACWRSGGLALGRIFFWPIGICVVGVYFLIDGLAGEDGVW